MIIIVVDDERLAMEGLVDELKSLRPNDEIEGFTSAVDAIEYVRKNRCQIAFLDIEMFDMDGVTAANELQSIDSNINIIFTTAYNDYTMDALNIHASGYILKPISRSKLENELRNLRHIVQNNDEIKKLEVSAFGDFQVHFDNKPLNFKYSKTKELLAYLIDRKGAMCSKKDICAVLFGDEYESKGSYYYNLVADLKSIFADLGIEDVIDSNRGKVGIRQDLVECDYYHWLDDPKKYGNLYMGEYMNQYSWAEYTNAWLSLQSE